MSELFRVEAEWVVDGQRDAEQLAEALTFMDVETSSSSPICAEEAVVANGTRKKLQIVHCGVDHRVQHVVALGFDPQDAADKADLDRIEQWAKGSPARGSVLAVAGDVEVEHVRW